MKSTSINDESRPRTSTNPVAKSTILQRLHCIAKAIPKMMLVKLLALLAIIGAGMCWAAIDSTCEVV